MIEVVTLVTPEAPMRSVTADGADIVERQARKGMGATGGFTSSG